MLLEIGKIPYTDKDAPANQAIKHKSVYVRSLGRNYVIQVEGLNPVELPNPSGDKGEIIFRAKKFIRRNKGSVNKRIRHKMAFNGTGWAQGMLAPVTPATSYADRKKKRKPKRDTEETPVVEEIPAS